MALAVLARALRSARRGEGRAVFLVGDPGVGKTALLEAARYMAGDTMGVRWSRASVMESDLPLALAEQLAAPDQPPSPGATGGGDPISGRALLLDLARAQLRAWSATSPLLVLADDLHWSDPDSLGLIAFLARRLSWLPVALVGALRPWPAPAGAMARALAAEGAAELVGVDALSPAASAELLAELAGPQTRAEMLARAADLARGNPHLLVVAARSSTETDLPELGTTDLGRLQSALVLSRLVGLPPAALTCARAAAVCGGRFRVSVAEAVSGLQPEGFAEAFDVLVAAGILLPVGGGWARFDHDLLASAIHDDTAPAQRRLLHARAFRYHAGAGDPSAAAPHAVAADLRGDRRAVATLALAGARALAHGAVHTGVAQIAAAIDLDGPEPSDRLLAQYGDALFATCRPQEALAAYRRLVARAGDPAARAEAGAKVARALAFAGRLDEAQANYHHLLAGDLDTALSMAVRLELSHVVWEREGPGAALASLEPVGVQDGAAMVEAVRGYFRLEAGDPGGLDHIQQAAAQVGQHMAADPAGALATFNLFSLQAAAWAMTERYQEAYQLVALGIDWLRAGGGLRSTVPLRILRLGLSLNQGRLHEVLAEADDLEQEMEVDALLAPHPLLLRAQALVWLGRSAQAATICQTVAAMPGARSWLAAISLGMTRGRLLTAGGRHEAAADAFAGVEELVGRYGVGEPCLPPWASGAMEAALAAGRPEQSERVAGWLEAASAPLPCTWPRMVALAGRAGCAAAAGRQGEADELYRRALELPPLFPLDRAQILLRYGSWLRRRHQSRRARPVLAEALQVAEELGAEAIARPAAAELSAAGGRRRHRGEAAGLTTQEARVASLAITGATTREIASELRLSPRTVESHLGHIYLKLGVSSKTELRQRKAELGLSA